MAVAATAKAKLTTAAKATGNPLQQLHQPLPMLASN
eukprot:CAMPEP_0172736306 /NCGR_PEP_ID=MMETSP1074-20121228/114751_1 /TAXON_ID=2916 /ORGANISM="Ceratium fusus, Strain PA161109" /LENGTH=35 /DNA_ID= /DNA_START= /DNA_END= /DNA_ORIENTATION=